MFPQLCLLKEYQCECHNYIYFCARSLLSISYCAKYSTIETNDSFSLEILKDINCIAYALKVCFI